MKTLYLLRHAKAEPGGKDISDKERILSARGREACAIMGAHMKAKAYLPSVALSSPSMRTKETLSLVMQAADIEPDCRFNETLYLAGAEDIMRALWAIEKSVSSVMVVGHNPGMHHAAILLSDPRRTPLRLSLELKYPTCSLSVLRFSCNSWDAIAPAAGMLLDFITPNEL